MQNRRRVRLKLKTKKCYIVVVFDKIFELLFNNKTLEIF